MNKQEIKDFRKALMAGATLSSYQSGRFLDEIEKLRAVVGDMARYDNWIGDSMDAIRLRMLGQDARKALEE